jgi:hypothetical protein
MKPVINAIYSGPLAACLGRDPDKKECPELYTMKGIEGHAFQQIELPSCMWYFIPDGYLDDEEDIDVEGDYTYRVHISHLHFYK